MVNSLNQLTLAQWIEEFKSLMDDNKDREISAGVDMDTKQSAVISCDLTLFIRLLEVAREELKTDEQLHDLVERCSEAQALKDGFLTMDDYQAIMGSSTPSEVTSSVPHLAIFKAALVKMGTHYWTSVPLDGIARLAQESGMVLLDEDGSEWSGLVTGAQGRCSIALGAADSLEPLGIHLHMQWHKMASGRFEINCYVN